jgi:hypothetical protein
MSESWRTLISVRAATAALSLLVMIGSAMPVDAQQKPPQSPSPDAKASPDAPVYKPPMRGAPAGRVGGGTRGTGHEAAFVLSVLAPNHTGLTVSEQPSLFWFISNDSSYPVELTLVDPGKTDPLIELRIAPPVKAGVHRVQLKDHNVRLVPGVSYQWYVAVVPDNNRRSKDILAGGSIERVSSPADLTAKLSQAAKSQVPSLYAEAGLWYDALAAIGELIEQAPQDAALVNQRSALLRQVGLPDARDN